MAKSVGHPVQVTWNDAWHNGTQYFDEEEIGRAEGKILYSYGLCVRDDKVGVVIAMDDLAPNSDMRYRDVKFIPRGMVKKVKVLR